MSCLYSNFRVSLKKSWLLDPKKLRHSLWILEVTHSLITFLFLDPVSCYCRNNFELPLSSFDICLCQDPVLMRSISTASEALCSLPMQASFLYAANSATLPVTDLYFSFYLYISWKCLPFQWSRFNVVCGDLSPIWCRTFSELSSFIFPNFFSEFYMMTFLSLSCFI